MWVAETASCDDSAVCCIECGKIKDLIHTIRTLAFVARPADNQYEKRKEYRGTQTTVTNAHDPGSQTLLGWAEGGQAYDAEMR